MAHPLLSVVMPVHDGEHWLAQTLDSLLVQDDRSFECVIVDSSSDNSRDVARSYADRLPLTVHHRPDLPSWQAKTDAGVALAEGSHVCMLHQDDLWLPGRAARVRAWIAAAPEAVLHLHPCAIVDGTGRRLGVWRCPLPESSALDARLVLDRLLVQNFVAIPAPVIRRDAYQAVGGLDGALWYTADWDLYLKLAAFGPVAYHDEVLAGFRVHGASLTVTGSRKAADFQDQMDQVLARHAAKAGGGRRVMRAARASVAINAALAAANHGEAGALLSAARTFVGLGPVGAAAYLRDSRLLERVVPRLKARVAGAF